MVQGCPLFTFCALKMWHFLFRRMKKKVYCFNIKLRESKSFIYTSIQNLVSQRWWWVGNVELERVDRECIGTLKIWNWSPQQHINQSIGMNRMRWFLAVLRNLLHSSLLYAFSCHSSPPTIIPSSLTSSSHLFLGLPLGLLFPNSCTILFWESYFLPFSVHVQTNVIYAALLSLL